MSEIELRKIVREEVTAALGNIFQSGNQVMDTEQALEYLGVSNRTTLTRYHQQGLPYIKGTPNRYVKSDLDKFIIDKRICLTQ
jgi:hypothetical protein